MLRCPKCGNGLNKQLKSYVCVLNHSYDISKEGYVNLVLNYHQDSGDNKDLIEARRRFLNLGHYAFLRETLIEIMQHFPHEVIVDAGCGEGYYTNEFGKYFENVIGIDLSKEGIKKASKGSNVIYVINSIQDMAIMDKSADIVLSLFSYRNLDEFNRILKDEGYYIEVLPDQNHLIELKKAIYDEVYLNEENEKNEIFEKIDQIHIKNRTILNQSELQDLFKMTPYYYKTSLNDKAKLTNISELEVTFSFIVNVYMKKEAA